MRLIFLMIVGFSMLLMAQEHKHYHGSSPHSCSKPSGYVTMHYNLANIEIEQPIDINITLKSDMNTKIIDYQVIVDQNLETLEKAINKEQIGEHEQVDIKLKTIAHNNGAFYIKLYTQAVSIDDDQNIRYKSFIVPVQVGKKHVVRQRSNRDNGENLKIFHGMESIR